jgi:hypothetical protein
MKRHHLDALLLGTGALSLLAMGLAHEDPWLRSGVCDVLPCIKSDAAVFWNKIFYDLAVGTLLSLVFYWLLVRIPELSRNARLRQRLERHYDALKRECVVQLLFASGGEPTVENIERLATNPVAFRDHFYAAEGAPWYRAMNQFDHPDTNYFERVREAFQIFKEELDFTIDHAHIGDDQAFGELKDLSLLMQDAISIPKDYDGTKGFFGILQMVLGGWAGGGIGTVDHDLFARSLARL